MRRGDQGLPRLTPRHGAALRTPAQPTDLASGRLLCAEREGGGAPAPGTECLVEDPDAARLLLGELMGPLLAAATAKVLRAWAAAPATAAAMHRVGGLPEAAPAVAAAMVPCATRGAHEVILWAPETRGQDAGWFVEQPPLLLKAMLPVLVEAMLPCRRPLIQEPGALASWGCCQRVTCGPCTCCG